MNETVTTGLHLLRPEWLWGLLPAALLGAWLWRLRGRGGGWSQVIDPELLPHLLSAEASGRRTNLLPLILLAWILACVAAAGPSWKKIPQPVHQAQDALVLILDLSYSMKAADMPPSRIDRARQKLLDLLSRRNEGQTALVAYAGDAHIVTPLTDDNPTIANLLPALNPDMMPLPGSDPVAAVSLALDLLRSAGVRDGRMLLLSDGVEPREVDAIADLLAGSGTRLSVLAVGTTTGAPMPLPGGGFLKNASGEIVVPGLVAEPLRQLARAAGGEFSNLRLDDADLERVLAPVETLGQRDTIALERTADTWEDQGHWLLLALLPLVLGLFRRGWILGLLPLVLLIESPRSHAQGWDDLWRTPDQRGSQALQAGDPARAAELFEHPEWAATAAYEAGDYERAAELFGEGDSADHWYNRGNALARSGQLDEALQAYDESLARDPEREDAIANRELVEQLKQQQEQQQEQQDQQGEQQSDSQRGDQSDDPAPQQEQSSADSGQQPGEPGDGSQAQSQPQDPSGREPPSDESQPSPSQDDESQQREQASDARADETDEEPAPPTSAEALTEQQARDIERDQAMEQWLRRVPDDPSGLLREKFRYESRQRQREGGTRQNEKLW